MDSKKWGSNPPDLYPKMLGQLVANIATLELSLRVVIYLHEVPVEQRQPVAKRLTSLRAGDTLEVSSLTSWDSLGELIAKYNLHNPGASIPEDIKDLRDAFAHGRILADNPTSDLKLVRFSRPKGGSVTVELAQEMSIEWMGEQIHKIHDIAETVQRRIRELSAK
jgi:hypothetical protein